MDTRTRNKEELIDMEQDVQRDLWTKRLSRRAQEEKAQERGGDGGKI